MHCSELGVQQTLSRIPDLCRCTAYPSGRLRPGNRRTLGSSVYVDRQRSNQSKCASIHAPLSCMTPGKGIIDTLSCMTPGKGIGRTKGPGSLVPLWHRVLPSSPLRRTPQSLFDREIVVGEIMIATGVQAVIGTLYAVLNVLIGRNTYQLRVP